MMAAEIVGVGMVTPVGLAAAPTAAAVRAGIARLNESTLRSRDGEPRVMGLVPEEQLPPLALSPETRTPPTAHAQRLLRLAAGALQEALERCPDSATVPVFLGLHEPWPELPAPAEADFLKHLARQAQSAFAVSRSKVFPQGRASGVIALQHALKLLSSDRKIPLVVAGGVDSYLAPELLARLDHEGRLPSGPVTDGFIPGEGAAFLLLARPGEARRLGLEPIAEVAGVGLGDEKGHRYSATPYLGEGLAEAFARLFAQAEPPSPIQCVYSGLNGESFWAKEWGVAYLRNAKRFVENVRIEHPVQNVGDPGAALGPLMVGLAAMGIQRGYRQAPCLVWCSSDHEARGAVLVRAPHGHESKAHLGHGSR
jgi:3-oxoacyl-[acyl-carrier-protein] synthase-1